MGVSDVNQRRRRQSKTTSCQTIHRQIKENTSSPCGSLPFVKDAVGLNGDVFLINFNRLLWKVPKSYQHERAHRKLWCVCARCCMDGNKNLSNLLEREREKLGKPDRRQEPAG